MPARQEVPALMPGYVSRLARDSAFYGVLDVANRFVGVLLVPLYTRVLSPADYGVLDLLITLLTMINAVLILGLDSALTYYYNRAGSDDERRRCATTAAVTSLASVGTGTLLLLLLRDAITGAAMPGVPHAPQLLVLAALSLPFQAVLQTQGLVLRIRFAFRRFALLSLGQLVLTVGSSMYFVLVLRQGIEGILLALLWARVAMAIVGLVITHREFSLSLSLRYSALLVRYGAPLVLTNVTYWAVLYMERYALLRMGGMEEVGLYGIAVRIATFATLATMAIDIAWMPFAMSIQREPQAPTVYARVLSYYALAAGIAGTGIAVFAYEGLVLLTQPEYYQAFVLVGPIVAALVLRGVLNIMAIGVFLRRRTGVVSAAALVTAAVDVALLIALIPRLGALGAAFATLLARAAGVAYLHRRARILYPVPYDWGRLARLTVIFAAAIVAGVYATRIGLWGGIAVKLLVILPACAAALLATGCITPPEIREALGFARRSPLLARLHRGATTGSAVALLLLAAGAAMAPPLTADRSAAPPAVPAVASPLVAPPTLLCGAWSGAAMDRAGSASLWPAAARTRCLSSGSGLAAVPRPEVRASSSRRLPGRQAITSVACPVRGHRVPTPKCSEPYDCQPATRCCSSPAVAL
jgi:O-antigen/teichoic acid export membrane protein